MIRSIKTLLLLAAVVALAFADNCTDLNCKTCANTSICDVCSGGYVLLNNICQLCSSSISNCDVCNDTKYPVGCISCSNGFYSNSDYSSCVTCGSLIQDCAQCEYQAPFEKAKCSLCIDDLNLSPDKYSCVEPITVTVIIVAAVVLGVICLALGGKYGLF